MKSNGADVAPAIITRVWSDSDTDNGPVCVNAVAFPDAAQGTASTNSVPLYKDKAHADASGNPDYAAWWPERT